MMLFPFNDIEIRPGRCIRVYEGRPDSMKGTVVFCHGIGGRAEQFEHQLQFVADAGFRFIAFDMLGHGSSQKPVDASYSFQELLLDFKELFQRCKKDGKCWFVGHSYGTMLVLHLVDWILRNQLSSVAGIALLGSSATKPSVGGLALYLPSTVLEWLRPIARNGFNRAAFDVSTSPALIEKENAITSNNPMAIIKAIGFGLEWTIPDEAKEFIFPILIISGRSDGITPVSSAEPLCTLLPNSSLIIVEDASHNLMLEKPEQVNTHIMKMLQS